MTRILEFTDPGQDDLVSLRPDSRLLHAWLDDIQEEKIQSCDSKSTQTSSKMLKKLAFQCNPHLEFNTINLGAKHCD